MQDSVDGLHSSLQRDISAMAAGSNDRTFDNLMLLIAHQAKKKSLSSSSPLACVTKRHPARGSPCRLAIPTQNVRAASHHQAAEASLINATEEEKMPQCPALPHANVSAVRRPARHQQRRNSDRRALHRPPV